MKLSESGAKLFDFRIDGTLDSLKNEGLNLVTNEAVELILQENPSTGFTWQIDTFAANGLWTVSEEYVQPTRSYGQHQMVGVPGHKKITLNINASKTGDGVFRAAYVRHWEFSGFDQFRVPNASDKTWPFDVVEFKINVANEN